MVDARKNPMLAAALGEAWEEGSSAHGADGLPSFQRTLPARLGRYTLVARIGTGGMAEVFRATCVGDDGAERTVVVKLLLPHLASSKKYVRMFEREASLASRLDHENVVGVLEFVTTDGLPYIVMEYVDGIPLHRLARRAWAHGLRLPLELCVTAIADAALGLAHAHVHGLIHRDISPDNLMITRAGVTRLLDFGIARSDDTESVTRTGELKGKFPFMAPEVIRAEPFDARADLYSLGVTFFWLLTGRRPFRGHEIAALHTILTQPPPPPRSFNPSIPAPLNDLILALLEKDPARRVADAHSIHAALDVAPDTRAAVVAPFVARVLALPERDDGSDEDTSTAGFIASEPSATLAELLARAPRGFSITASTGAHDLGLPALPPAAPAVPAAPPAPTPRTRQGALAAAGAGLLGLLAVVAFVVVGGDEPAGAPAPASTPPALAPSPSPSSSSPSPFPSSEPAPPPAPPAASSEPPPPASPAASSEPPPPPRGRPVALKAPSSFEWRDGKRVLGKGSVTAEVPPGVARLVAIDGRRGSRHDVPIVAGVADVAALPRAHLQVRAFPFAEVSLGSERLGTTPLNDVTLPAGTYAVTLRYEDRTERRTVTLSAGGTERLMVRFE
jgi:serine/threonine-protein kinase